MSRESDDREKTLRMNARRAIASGKRKHALKLYEGPPQLTLFELCIRIDCSETYAGELIRRAKLEREAIRLNVDGTR